MYVNYSYIYIYICISMIKTFIVCDWCFVLSHESIGTSRYTHEKKNHGAWPFPKTRVGNEILMGFPWLIIVNAG